jgi:hypothetical protein
MQKTMKLIQNIEKIFERGLQDEYLSRAIRKVVEHTKERTLTDVEVLKNDLSQFEGKYGIPSDEFFNRFEKGELGDDGDYFEWSAIFQMYKRATERLKMLEGVS